MPNVNMLLVPAAIAAALATSGSAVPRPVAPPAVSANENRTAAGVTKGGMLEVSLEVREGEWHPYGPQGPAVRILAFGETGKPLETPGPMIRVKEGARVHVRVLNTANGTLVVHGLTARHTTMPDTLVVPAGATRDVTFTADAQGTYFYWGTTTGVGFSGRLYEDAQLNGALIVDPPTGTPKPDRVFVIQWYLPRSVPPDTAADAINGFFTFNGMPWPNTERLKYAQGDSVRWRIINATADVHPLHLHGFFYRITARGDANRDTLYWPAQERMAVTELMDVGTTMNLAWYADRPGAWIFHCHLNWHVVPNPPLGAARETDSVRLHALFATHKMTGMPGMANHSETGMGGLVLRIDIAPSATWRPYTGPRERFRLYIQSDSQPGDTLRRFGYALATGNDVPAPNAIQWPGPPIILHVGQPTSITVINRALEPSQVHWHGLEIDSYYDGVAGLSRDGAMVSPLIMPRDSFEMTVTPPRAGSFMYHTHVNDLRQQSHGLYGPIIVLPLGQAWDPSSDLIFMAGTDPLDDPILNGSTSPPALTIHAGRPYRIRLMNITLDAPFNQMVLTAANGAVPLWTAIAKDGFDLPVWQRRRERARQRVSIGETYDFRLTIPAPGEYTMEGRRGNGTVYARQVIHVVP
ncbi:MAG TPA: multicopper oxidase domain-containing protein [Gemmatimonadaceae bacterium]|nr:multicopper oxidase domain-containing protein [Gemmatimonadaceae bacterium]